MWLQNNCHGMYKKHAYKINHRDSYVQLSYANVQVLSEYSVNHLA